MSKETNHDIIPPIYKWAESLSSNLEKLQTQIKSDAADLEQFYNQHTNNDNASISTNKKSIVSPKSPTTPKSTKSARSSKSSKSAKSARSSKSSHSRATHLSPIATSNATTIRSPSSVQSLKSLPKLPSTNTGQTIISFQPNPTNIENVNVPKNNKNQHKMFHDLPESLHNTANKVTSDGERIIADVAKKIWGKHVPKTFLTALDMEIPISDDESYNDDYSSSVYSSYKRSQVPSRQSNARRKSITLPALEVTRENIPEDLTKQNLGFPEKADPDTIIPQIIETTQFENDQQQNVFMKCVMSNGSLDIISDGFWWFLIDEWKIGKMENENDGNKDAMNNYKETRDIVFSRMCKRYVKMFLSAPQKHKDMIFDNYYDLMSQSIFTCFVQQYPKSKDLFTNDIKLKILHITAKWTMGCVPSSLSINHWYITNNLSSNNQNQNNKNQADNSLQETDDEQNENKSIENIIPTRVMKKDVVFTHSEFVAYYLKHEAKIEVDNKTVVRINMTFAKPSTEKLSFYTSNEEAMKCETETELANTKFVNSQKELAKMIKNDTKSLKEYETELEQQLFIAKKNKKQFVKDILKQLIPNQLTENENDGYT